MAAIGASDGGSAADRARAKLASGGGGGSTKTPASPYQIPIRVGGFEYLKSVNQGQFDDDIHTTTNLKQKEYRDKVLRFSLTDDGVNAAMGTWYSMEDEERAALSKKMWYLGLIKDPNDFDGAYTVWKSAVEHAGRFAMTGKEIDPADVLDMMGDAENGPGSKKHAGPITSRQIDLTNPETAKAWIQQAFQQSMGRAAEDAEVRALADALGSRERSNPRITTTTPTKFDDAGNPIESETVTSGGFDSEGFLQNQIANDPEATAHQAAGELYPALLAALGGGLS